VKFVRFPQNLYSKIETGGSAGKIPQREKRRLRENGEGIKKKKKKRSCAHSGPQISFEEEQKKKKEKEKEKEKEKRLHTRLALPLAYFNLLVTNELVCYVFCRESFCLLRRLKRRMDCMRDKRKAHSDCSGPLRGGKDEGGEEQPAAERAARNFRESPFSAYLRPTTN